MNKTTRRRHITAGELWRETNERCVYCGKTFTGKARSMEHLIPRSLGGTKSRKNLVAACKPCNWRRGSTWPLLPLVHADFKAYMAKRITVALRHFKKTRSIPFTPPPQL